VAELLLSNGADARVVDSSNEETALQMALSYERPEFVPLIRRYANGSAGIVR
jgi:hypothetical protein